MTVAIPAQLFVYCRAAYCVEQRGHTGRHTPLHYNLLALTRVRPHPNAVCECHADLPALSDT